MTSYSPSQQAAAAELWRRRKAKSDILHYSDYIDIPGKPANDDDECDIFKPIESQIVSHHVLILSSLDRISRTPHGRLMIFMPPGSAKSTYASVVFPSHFIGREIERRLILASYGDTLAKKMGRRTRQIVREQQFENVFKCSLNKESKAVDNFSLTNGSEYMACGILAGITGNRAHGIIIDDPVKGREEADSEVVREKVYEAYQSDLKTRLIPGGWICIIQTRWHEDDLSGRILPDNWKGESGKILCKDGNEWEVICLQARCEVDNDPLGRKQGEYLWPEWFDEKHWSQFESSSRTWSALYQQLPAPKDGEFFKPSMIEIVPVAPAGIRKKTRAWDLAASKDKGDYTAGVLMGETQDGRPIILDVVRDRLGPDGVERLIKNTAALDGRTRIRMPQDPGQAGKAQVKSFSKLLMGKTVVFLPVTGSKETRASAFAAQVNVGNVMMVKADWNQALIDELRPFPNGRNDDQVDAGSDAFNDIFDRGPMRISEEAINKMKQAH